MNEFLASAAAWYLLISSALGCVIMLLGLVCIASALAWRVYRNVVDWNTIYHAVYEYNVRKRKRAAKEAK